MYLKNSSHLPFPNRWRKDFYEKKNNFRKFEYSCTRDIIIWCKRKVVPKGGGRKYINTLLRVIKKYIKKISSGPGTNNDNLFSNFCRRTIKTWKSWPSFLSFKSRPSLLSIATNDSKQFQRLNEVLSNRTGPFFFLEFTDSLLNRAYSVTWPL